jgi:outer membrane protein TolC
MAFSSLLDSRLLSGTVVSFLLVGALPLSAQVPPDVVAVRTLELTPDQAVALVLQANYTIAVERLDDRVAEAAVREAQGQYDPVLYGSYYYTNTEVQSFGNAESQEANAEMGLQGFLPWGTSYEIGASANDRTTPFASTQGTDQIIDAGDSVTAFTGVTLNQPLLRGFGLADSYAVVRVAKMSRSISREALRASTINTITAALQAYYTLAFAEQNLQIAQRNRSNAANLLEENRRRIEIGAMAPLDIYQAESEVAFRDSQVLNAELFRHNAENRLKLLLTSDPADIMDLRLKIATLPDPTAPEDLNPRRDYAVALSQRPDYLQSTLGLEISELELAREKRQALPRLDLTASYGRRYTGRELDNTFDRAVDEGSESYTVGAVFSYPLFNRSRDASRTASYLRRNRSELVQRQLEQQIMFEIDAAAQEVETAWLQIATTRHARELAEQSLAAEEKKLQVGNSSTFFVLRLQGDLASAEIREMQAITDYLIARSEYDRVLGATLERRRIVIE